MQMAEPSSYRSTMAPHQKKHFVLNSEIKPQDVLFGKGGSSAGHIGTIAFKAIVESRLETYRNAKSYSMRNGKNLVTLQILNLVQLTGGRFLVKAEDQWCVMDTKTACIKVREFFREFIKNLRKQRRPCVLLDRIGVSGLFGMNSTYVDIILYIVGNRNILNFLSTRSSQIEKRNLREESSASTKTGTNRAISSLANKDVPLRSSSKIYGNSTVDNCNFCISAQDLLFLSLPQRILHPSATPLTPAVPSTYAGKELTLMPHTQPEARKTAPYSPTASVMNMMSFSDASYRPNEMLLFSAQERSTSGNTALIDDAVLKATVDNQEEELPTLVPTIQQWEDDCRFLQTSSVEFQSSNSEGVLEKGVMIFSDDNDQDVLTPESCLNLLLADRNQYKEESFRCSSFAGTGNVERTRLNKRQDWGLFGEDEDALLSSLLLPTF